MSFKPSSLFKICLSAVALFAIGLGVRIWAQSNFKVLNSQDQVALAAAPDAQTYHASSNAELSNKAATPTPNPALLQAQNTRNSLFNDKIQSHLDRVVQKIQTNGIEIRLSNYYQSGGHLFVSVCFDQPGTEVWQMGPATLKYANGEVSSFYGHITLNQRGSPDGKIGQQCNTLEFVDLPAGADLSGLNLTIESVLLEAPAEGKECDVYNNRLANSIKLEQQGIKAECVPGAGYSLFRVISKPATMTEDEAQILVSQEAAGFVIGPWIFTMAQ
jgi:hypothetical protein